MNLRAGVNQRLSAASGMLLHPVTLGAMALLAVNDHWGKYAWPGWLTGKLSDCAGLVFFPILLVFAGLSRRWAVGLTAIGFTLVKTVPPITDSWNWIFTSVYQLCGYAEGAQLVCDPSDLIALPFVLVCLLLPGGRR